MLKNNKLFIIGPDIENEISGPSIWIKNLLDWLRENNIKFEIIKWFKLLQILKLFKIIFYKNIYLNWIVNKNIIYFLAKIFYNKKFIIWPNFLPHKKIIYLKNCLYLSPSNWHKKYLIKTYNFKKNLKILKFPINNEIKKLTSTKKWKIVIYYKNLKNTNETEETRIKKINIYEDIKRYLSDKNHNYITIEYWDYNYNDWINILKDAKIVIFITWTETQSITKYEALNFNIPILNYAQNIRLVKETNVLLKYWSTLPDINQKIYWKDFNNLNNFINSLNFILINYNSYNPKNYIIKNFNSKYITSKLLDLYRKI